MRANIFRYDPASGEKRYDVFELEARPGMTVLAALFHVQDEFDASLSFRYSCRGAVCGSCAMLINKVPRLACRTQVSSLLAGEERVSLKPYPAIEGGETWDPTEEILIEPLPHLPVLKDLVVDMSRFFEYYRAMEPVLKPDGPAPERERLTKPSAVEELEHYTNCILCASCFGACPVGAKDPAYLGPAALAKLYRFHIDPRERAADSRLLLADKPEGWWACEFHTNCKRVCPKGVPPNVAIGRAQARLKTMGKTGAEKNGQD
jgi:succinate dehydrogenase / fumarate reductase iron-sulfur subunit